MSGADAGWTPVLKDDVYCSPRCGCNCTKTGFDRATVEARALCDRMGPGWEPHVWENGGWHYRIRKGCASIRTDTTGSILGGDYTVTGYSAWIEPTATGCPGDHHTLAQFIEHAEDPEDALGFATQAARTHIARLSAALAEVLP